MGPNLVIALLMDAPQLRTRWPARYATVLSEDPGSAVLTLTSRALMRRQQLIHEKSGAPSPNMNHQAIALWRDSYWGDTKELDCPPDCQAIWLKLWSSEVTDASLDGRGDATGKNWIYGKHRALKAAGADCRYADILGTSIKSA